MKLPNGQPDAMTQPARRRQTAPLLPNCLAARCDMVITVLLLITGTRAAAQASSRLAAPDAVGRTQFTQVATMRELPDGRVLLGDQRELRLVVLDWKGEATQIGRGGNGPSEYRGIGGLYAFHRDSTLFVDAFHFRRMVLDPGPRMVRSFPRDIPFGTSARTELVGTDTLGRLVAVVLPPSLLTAAPDSVPLVRAPLRGGRVDTLGRMWGGDAGKPQRIPASKDRPLSILFGGPLSSRDEALVFRDGWIAVAHARPYRVDWYPPHGRPLSGKPLPIPMPAVSRQEQCFAWHRYFGPRRPCEPAAIRAWPKTVPPFQRRRDRPVLIPSPDGSLLIARIPVSKSPGNRYDVVNRQGRLAAVIEMPPNEWIIGAGRAHVYTIEQDEVGLETVQRRPWR